MKLKNWLSAFALFSVASLAQAQNEIESGHQAFLVRDFSKAITFYEKGLQQSANNIEAQVNLAYAYQLTNQPSKSAQWFEAALKNANALSDYPGLPFHYGEVLKMQGKYSEAKSTYKLLSADNAQIINDCVASCDFAIAQKQVASPFTVRNESSVNTEHSEFAPVLFKNKLYFASTRPVYLELVQGYSTSNENWIYTSDRNLNTAALGTAKSLFTNSMENQNMSPLSISSDGKTIASMMQNALSGGIRHIPNYNILNGSIDIMTAISDDNWTVDPSRAFSFYGDMEDVTVGFPALSADGKTLYFSSNVNSSYGGFDIFVSFFQNGKWSEPQNLGPEVNTAGDEIAPFIADDGTLYFASNYLPGFGGFDIFSATYNANKSNLTWTNVKNLGYGVNSSSDDLYFVYDIANKQAYFASNREGGKGDYDIYSAKVNGNLNALANVGNNGNNNVIVYYPNDFIAQTTTNIIENTTPVNNSTASTTKPSTNTTTTTPSTTNTTNTTKPTTTTPSTTTPNTVATTDRNVANNTNNVPKTSSIDVDDLPCANNFYVGAIIDAVTRQPLNDVTIYIKNLRTQAKEKTNTNKYGEYSILLDPMTEYMLVASKNGYQNETFQVETKDGVQRTILGTHALSQAGTVVASNVDVFGDAVVSAPSSSTASRGLGATTETNYTSVNTFKGSTKYTPASSNSIMPDTGYLIQVGTFTKALSDDKITQLSEYGNIISEKKANGAITYRVGIFADKPHADQSLAAIKKIGYSDAWELKTAIDNNSFAGKLSATTQVIFPYQETSNNTATSNITGGSTPIIKETAYDNWSDNGQTASRGLGNTTTTSTTNNNAVLYSIQLGAYKDISKVSFANLSDIGEIYTKVESNGLTYFYLGKLNNLEAAKVAKQKLENRGNMDSFIVAFKNNVRISLAEAAKL